MKQEFLNKRCRLTYLSGFVLVGWVMDLDEDGIIFRSETQTAFINWSTIRDLKILEEE
jgi:hypothetical protein